MKKIFVVLFLLVFISACSRAPKEENTQIYSNSHYQFSISYPESYLYCINDFCYNDLDDDLMTLFLLKNKVGAKVVSMMVYVNQTGMSAVEFGKQSFELNRQYGGELKEFYTEESEITFAGENAYSFLATSGFKELGASLGTDEKGYMALVKDWSTLETPTLSYSFPGEEYRVVYVEYGTHIYRILYLNTEETEAVMDSFEFIK